MDSYNLKWKSLSQKLRDERVKYLSRQQAMADQTRQKLRLTGVFAGNIGMDECFRITEYSYSQLQEVNLEILNKANHTSFSIYFQFDRLNLKLLCFVGILQVLRILDFYKFESTPRPQDKSAYWIIIFFISHPKHML